MPQALTIQAHNHSPALHTILHALRRDGPDTYCAYLQLRTLHTANTHTGGQFSAVQSSCTRTQSPALKGCPRARRLGSPVQCILGGLCSASVGICDARRA